jgi:hypothetical protein
LLLAGRFHDFRFFLHLQYKITKKLSTKQAAPAGSNLLLVFGTTVSESRAVSLCLAMQFDFIQPEAAEQPLKIFFSSKSKAEPFSRFFLKFHDKQLPAVSWSG